MKIVKVCPECRKYNNYKLYECNFCGANLSDDVLEVEDDAIEAIKEVEKQEVISHASNKSQLKLPEEDAIVCPMCGVKNTTLWCSNCGQYLEGIETPNEKTSISFRLNFEKHTFSFIASSTPQILGRHDFDELNNDDFICVSRNHIEYYCKNSQLYFKDVSSYGSFLNGNKMEKGKEYLVNEGDVVKFVYFDMEINF